MRVIALAMFLCFFKRETRSYDFVITVKYEPNYLVCWHSTPLDSFAELLIGEKTPEITVVVPVLSRLEPLWKVPTDVVPPVPTIKGEIDAPVTLAAHLVPTFREGHDADLLFRAPLTGEMERREPRRFHPMVKTHPTFRMVVP